MQKPSQKLPHIITSPFSAYLKIDGAISANWHICIPAPTLTFIITLLLLKNFKLDNLNLHLQTLIFIRKNMLNCMPKNKERYFQLPRYHLNNYRI